MKQMDKKQLELARAQPSELLSALDVPSSTGGKGITTSPLRMKVAHEDVLSVDCI